MTWLESYVSGGESLFFVDKDGKEIQDCAIDTSGAFGPFEKLGKCSYSAVEEDSENIIVKYLLKTALPPDAIKATDKKSVGIEVMETKTALDPVSTDMTGSLSIIGPLDEADFSLNGEELTAGSLIQVVGDINLNISETDDPNWFIYFEQCWINMDSDHSASPKYDILTNSCDGDATVLSRSTILQMLTDGKPGINNSRNAVFRFPLFSWLNTRSSPQYLHCTLQACYKDDCEPNCPGKSTANKLVKRSIKNKRTFRASTLPFFVSEKSKNTKEDLNFFNYGAWIHAASSWILLLLVIIARSIDK